MILGVTSLPASQLPDTSRLPDADKLVHFGLYGVLAFLSVRAARLNGNRPSAAHMIATVAVFAALDEWHQRFVPGRTMDLRDWGADVLGALVGWLVFDVVRKHRER